MIVEGVGFIVIDYVYFQTRSEIYLSLTDSDHNSGEVWLEDKVGPNVLLEASFLIETVSDKVPASREIDQVWFKRSSASHLQKVLSITGNIRVRELTADEAAQMQEFKNSYRKLVIQKKLVHFSSFKVNAVHFSAFIRTWQRIQGNLPKRKDAS